MTEEMKSNYNSILKLVKERFYLTNKSQELFEKILFNQEHAEEFSQIAARPDKRLFVDLSADVAKKLDKSFGQFTSCFSSFVKSTSLTYEQYNKGVTQDGTKILKALKRFYTTPDNESILKILTLIWQNISIDWNKFIDDLFSATFSKKQLKNYDLEPMYQATPSHSTCKFFDEDGKLVFRAINNETRKNVILRKKITKKHWAKALEDVKIMEAFNSIVNKKFLSLRVTTDFKVCFSLNFADFLLCSTNNNWVSCLNLESDTGYWLGLAGLVGDKNRAVMFLTDGKEKTYNGIKSLNMIERMWIFTIIQDDKVYIDQNPLYPRKEENFNLVPFKNYLNDTEMWKEKSHGSSRRQSKYPIPTFWHKTEPFYKRNSNVPYAYTKFSSCVYEDQYSKQFTNDFDMMFYSSDGDRGISCFGQKVEKDKYGIEKKALEEVGSRFIMQAAVSRIQSLL